MLLRALPPELRRRARGQGRPAEITASLQAAGLRYTLLGGCTYDLGVYALSFLQRMTGGETADSHSRCIRGLEQPYLTEEFSVSLAETVDEVLKKTGCR